MYNYLQLLYIKKAENYMSYAVFNGTLQPAVGIHTYVLTSTQKYYFNNIINAFNFNLYSEPES